MRNITDIGVIGVYGRVIRESNKPDFPRLAYRVNNNNNNGNPNNGATPTVTSVAPGVIGVSGRSSNSNTVNQVNGAPNGNGGVYINIENLNVYLVSPRNNRENIVTNVDINSFLLPALKNIGVIKTVENPVSYALERINSAKNLIDTLVTNLAEKFSRIHVYEEGTRNGELYKYSVNLKNKNLKIHLWLENNNGRVNYSLDVKGKRAKLHEWISVNTNRQTVRYSLNLKTQNVKIHEYFRSTEAKYVYALDIKRKSSKGVKFEGYTIGSAHKEGNRIILTPNAYYQRGAIWSKEKFDLTKDFTVKAKLYLGNRPQGADGIAFVIQNSPQGRNALGMGGGGLGYRGIPNSLAVEFDTWRNPGEINGNHLGFDVNGKGVREVPTSEKVFALPKPLESGKEIPVTIKWNYKGNNKAELIVKIFNKTYKYFVNNILDIFGGTKAYIGFTGATGGERNLQYVTNVKVFF